MPAQIGTMAYFELLVTLVQLDIFFTIFQFPFIEALLNYIPNLQSASGDRHALIEEYFRLGFNYSEVLSFLLL